MVKSAKSISLVLIGVLTLSSFTGCRYGQWNSIEVRRTTAPELGKMFKAPIGPEDHYAYALSEDSFSHNTVLMMTDLDAAGIVTAKYYWKSVPRPIFPLFRMDSWEMAIETQIDPAKLQEYTASPGPREQAMLEYFGKKLFDTSRHFDHFNEIFAITGSMNQILALAAGEYDMRADKQTLLSRNGFAFDGGIHGNKCSMKLAAVNEREGIYRLELKGHRTRSFFSGW